MALNRKIAYIDLSTGEIKTAPIPIEMRKLYLGGRGLDMYLLYNHLKPGVDPLGPDNVLVVSAGILVGTLASASARTHIGAKSPLTDFIGSEIDLSSVFDLCKWVVEQPVEKRTTPEQEHEGAAHPPHPSSCRAAPPKKKSQTSTKRM